MNLATTASNNVDITTAIWYKNSTNAA